jgi:hypothetical protein
MKQLLREVAQGMVVYRPLQDNIFRLYKCHLSASKMKKYWKFIILVDFENS